jgi:fibronectin type 3 domain-containing protein
MSIPNQDQSNSSQPTSVVGRSSIWSLPKFSLRQYILVVLGLLVLAGGIVLFASSPPPPLYTGKLLGLNSSLDDLSAAGNSNAYEQLHLTSARGEIDLDGSSFGEPDYDGTTANWIDTLTTQHIVPEPILNQYIEIQDLAKESGSNIPVFVNATVSWCQQYCAGGTFYTNNSAADESYAPQALEILNEPYGTWWGYPVSTTDEDDYAALLSDLKSAFATAGLSNIKLLAAGDVNSAPQSGAANWDSEMAKNGGYAAAGGVTVHPYGPVDTVCSPSTSTTNCTVGSGDTSGTSTSGWGLVYYVHQFLVSNGLSTQANNIYATEVGYCNTTVDDPGCSGGQFPEQQKEQNISAIINTLATTSWLQGIEYFNAIPYKDCDGSNCAYNTYGLYTPPPTQESPSWAVFQTNAANVEAQYPSEFTLGSGGGGGGGDTTPPTVSITVPQSNATVSGTVNVSATASDNVGVTSLQFELDGKPLGPVDTGTSITSDSYSWNTTTVQNGNHTLTAIASDAAGNTTTATTISVTVSNKDTTPPSTPTGLKASAPTSAAVNLSWSASTDNVGVTEYKIYRNGALSALATVNATPGAAPSYTDSAVSASTQYSYTVTALDAAGNQSAQSAAATVTTPAATDHTPPSVPTNLHSTATTTSSISLAWNASTDNTGGSGVAGYHVYRGGQLIASPTGTSYVDTGLTSSTAYTYSVSAYDNAANGSAASTPITVTTQASTDNQPPSTPTGLKASAPTSAAVNLSWNASTDNVGVTEYKIYRVTGSVWGNGSSTALATVNATPGAAPTYIDSAVSASTAYTYEVTALDAAGNQSGHSAAATVTTPAAADHTPPTVPTNLHSTSTTTTSISLAWSPSTDTGGSGVAGYHVYRSGNLIASPSTTSYTDSNLNPGTAYTYSVSAYDNAANGSKASTPVTVSTQSVTKVNSVQNFKWNPSTKSLSWSAYPGATAYTIATVQNPTTTRNTTYTWPPVTGTGYTPVPLSGQTVNYGISPDTKNADGSYPSVPGSTWATEVTVTWPASTSKLGAPTNFHTISKTRTSISLSWSAPTTADSSGIAGYHLYRNGNLIASPTGTTYTNISLAANTTYTYTITAYDHAGNVSAATAPLSVKTKGRPWWHFW